MLGSSKMAIPKIAYVFDEDVDIWDDNEVKWAMAFRFDPIRDTVIIPSMNTMTVGRARCPPAVGWKTVSVDRSDISADYRSARALKSAA
jgi:UbiD family decarboxylase